MQKLLTVSLIALFAALPAHAQEITVTDMEGREVTLDAPASRIATFPMPMASAVVAMDGSIDRLVGMNPQSYVAHFEGLLGKIFPQAELIAHDYTGGDFMPNVEALVALQPDLVIQWGGQGNDIVDPLLNAGLNTILTRTGSEANVRGSQTLLANVIGKPERITEIVEWRQSVQDRIEAKTSGLEEKDRPTVLYLQSALNNIKAVGREGHYQSWYIEMTGGVSASADLNGTVPISIEQIAAWDPDVILLNSFEPALGVDWVYDNPILSQLKAAKEHRVYKLPLGGYRWDSGNQESPLTWMWLSSLLHPELFDFDMRTEMRDAFKRLYNYDASEEDIDNVLRLSMQGDATNYDQFKRR